ncbi:family 16 glycosylhydrolase [Paraconexibacter sp. AEG42_29]|uniref:family 16 glycosylhydrolase n=1 Tax=Paraconexibacter sp. AEG42_29 TaxID=2997339 RepID=UPI00339D4BF7
MTGSPKLYDVVRDGVAQVRLPVPRPGRYAVVLYMANPSPPPNQRHFAVTFGQQRLTPDVEAYAPRTARSPTHAVAEVVVTGRVLRASLRPLRGRPVLSAIEARRLGPVDMPEVAPVLADQFDGPAGSLPDPTRWFPENGGGYPHGELETTTGRPENVGLDGAGHLVITARAERFSRDGITRDYTSARLLAPLGIRLTRSFVRARMRVPSGVGLWSAFWLLGADPVPYPESGEVDIVEQLGNDPRLSYNFIHGASGPRAAPDAWQTGHTHRSSRRLDQGFHDYAMRSVPGAVEFQLDGRRTMTMTRADRPVATRWPLDRTYNLLLNISVGGDFPGPPLLSTPFPARLIVDDVSVNG